MAGYYKALELTEFEKLKKRTIGIWKRIYRECFSDPSLQLFHRPTRSIHPAATCQPSPAHACLHHNALFLSHFKLSGSRSPPHLQQGEGTHIVICLSQTSACQCHAQAAIPGVAELYGWYRERVGMLCARALCCSGSCSVLTEDTTGRRRAELCESQSVTKL